MNSNPLIQFPANIRIQLVRERKAPNVKVNSPEHVEELVGEYLRSLDRECVFALYLDAQNRVLGIEEISLGTLTASLLNPRDVVKGALLSAAVNVIIVHNHPSGSVEPSNEDLYITQRLQEVCQLFGINLLDHIIIGDGFRSIIEN